MLKLNVIFNDKREIITFINNDSSVKDLRKNISSKINVDVSVLEIVFKGMPLKDFQNISGLGIVNNSKIRGVIRKNNIVTLSRAKSFYVTNERLKEQMRDTILNRIENRTNIMGRRRMFILTCGLFTTKEDKKEKETVIPVQSICVSTDPLPVPF